MASDTATASRPRTGARPFDPALFARYCELLGEGKTTFDACEVLGVNRGDLWRWVNGKGDAPPDCAIMYASAREAQAEAHADEITSAAFAALAGEVDHNAARVFIDAMKWQASKLRPRIYGDRIDVSASLMTEHIERVELAPELRGVLESLGRKYARGIEAPRTLDVVPIPEHASPLTTEGAERGVRERKPKRERIAHMSPKRRAKYEANRAKLEAQRQALRTPHPGAPGSTPRPVGSRATEPRTARKPAKPHKISPKSAKRPNKSSKPRGKRR